MYYKEVGSVLTDTDGDRIWLVSYQLADYMFLPEQGKPHFTTSLFARIYVSLSDLSQAVMFKRK